MSALHEGAVVVGVDESVFSGQALHWAADQARLEGRRLVLVNASGPVPASWVGHGMDQAPGADAGLERHGHALLERARTSLTSLEGPELEIEEIFEVADPKTLLVELSHDAHVIVLGSRGRGPIRSSLLGSVGLAVVRHAKCPVVVLRPGHPGLVRRGVLVAVDATEESVPVLEFGFSQASLRRLPLTVVHCVYEARTALVGASMTGFPAVAMPQPEDPRDETEERALALSECLVGLRERYPDVHLTQLTLRDVPEHGLPGLSRGADLVVVGSHQRGPVGRLMAGSVSRVVIEHAQCPVAVVPLAGAVAAT